MYVHAHSAVAVLIDFTLFCSRLCTLPGEGGEMVDDDGERDGERGVALTHHDTGSSNRVALHGPAERLCTSIYTGNKKKEKKGDGGTGQSASNALERNYRSEI